MITPESYQLKKSLLGGRHISYPCPHCGDSLRSPFKEAGQQDSCPTCGNLFVVPGKDDFLRASKAQKQAREHAAHQKKQAKEEARRQKVQLAQQRLAAKEEAAANRAEQRRLAEETLQATQDTESAQSNDVNETQPRFFPWRAGGGTVAAIGIFLIYLFARGSDIREKLNRCESYGVVEAQVSYSGIVGTDTVIFDLRQGGSSGARRIDPIHLLLQFSSKLSLHSIDKVVLARDGRKRFYITSSSLRPLADSYKGGGRVWSFNNLPASVRRMDGTRAYDEWSGGWLGVLQKQTEDLNRFISDWTEYGSSGSYSTTTPHSDSTIDTSFPHNSDTGLRSRVRSTLRDMEDHVPKTLRSIEENLPDVLVDMEARMMADAAKYGLSPSDIRAQMREIEASAREQIRDMEGDVRERILGMEDEVIKSTQTNAW